MDKKDLHRLAERKGFYLSIMTDPKLVATDGEFWLEGISDEVSKNPDEDIICFRTEYGLVLFLEKIPDYKTS
jgi:hypothetical protein